MSFKTTNSKITILSSTKTELLTTQPTFTPKNYLHFTPPLQTSKLLSELEYLVWQSENITIEIWDVILFRFIYLVDSYFHVFKCLKKEPWHKIVVMKQYGPSFSFKEFSKFLHEYELTSKIFNN
jgi:hypothetical protein